ncbi:SpoIIE family protein phosphatase [Streptomyces sp. SID4950]|nr:SpoIIE family protein phosphatase [Streptomyces sp. SID4950]
MPWTESDRPFGAGPIVLSGPTRGVIGLVRIKAGVSRARSLGLPTVWGAMAITYKLVCPLAQQNGLGARIVTSAVFFAVGTGLVVHVRQALLRELREVRRVAGVAQNALLRPLPPRLDGLDVAAAQLSAEPGAAIGGDLYDVVGTEHGVRVVMGDVRGHGLGALDTVAAVLGSFREAAHDEPELGRVMRRLERALARRLRERTRAEHPAGAAPEGADAEEFVTVLLLEIRRDGAVRLLNCGHPSPYLLRGGTVTTLARAEPLPPLGLFPLPPDPVVESCGRLLPGETLVLHTDGAEDARDARGRFFALPDVLAAAADERPRALLGAVFTALLRHTGGSPADDVALLALRNDRRRALSTAAQEPARPGSQRPQPASGT